MRAQKTKAVPNRIRFRLKVPASERHPSENLVGSELLARFLSLLLRIGKRRMAVVISGPLNNAEGFIAGKGLNAKSAEWVIGLLTSQLRDFGLYNEDTSIIVLIDER